jgi:pantothenate kinase
MARLNYPPRARQTVIDGAEALAAVLRTGEDLARCMVAIAGPPGAGKSRLAAALCDSLRAAGESAAVVPMDGFHFDDRVLEARGLRARNGAPETFDRRGLAVLLARLRAGEDEVAIPVFDRNIELSRAGGAVVDAATRFVLVEGNYLLLDEPGWRDLAALFDLRIFLDVDRRDLERRLRRRWDQHGLSPEQAGAKVSENDLPNADRVNERRLPADLVVRG